MSQTFSKNSKLFAAAGGEMGRLMEATDWTRTSLGPPESWPNSLTTAVRIMLTSRQPMYIWWGEDFVNLYNDAYAPILGKRHPGALGKPAAKLWSEIWDEVGSRAKRAMESNEGTMDECMRLILERHGYPEETFYTFSYSPIPRDDGSAGGVLCVTTDETERMVSARRTAALRDVAAGFGDSRTIREASQRAVAGLAAASADLPVALLYVQKEDEGDEAGELRLAGCSVGGETPADVPKALRLDDESLPIAEALRTQRATIVSDLKWLGELPPNSDGSAIEQAVVVPIRSSSNTRRAALLIAGLNPLREFDHSYREFVELLSGQLAAGFANAEAHERERARAEALAEADRAKTAFFSNISHEFRTPLTLMIGPTEDAIAAGSGGLTGESLLAVHRNQLRLLKLVNMLLDFSRLEAGRAQAMFTPTDIGACTSEVAGMFRSAVERAGLDLEVTVGEGVDRVYLDREMWEKVVLNLLSNAFKFTFEGTIQVSVTQPEDDLVEVSVRDTGTGIPADSIDRVFERFHRVEGARSRSIEGSGIGLALVRDLVELHGGEIVAESELGKGTTIRVRLPVGSQHLDPEQIVEDPTDEIPHIFDAETFVSDAISWTEEIDELYELEADPGTTVAGRIVVADDNADMRDYIARILRPRFHVRLVRDGTEALEAVRSDPPDLLLTDVMMPGLDGFELLQQIRDDEALANLPVVMLSARAGDEARVEGLEAGADDYMVKPFSARELLARVESQVELKRLRARVERERASLARLFAQAPMPIAVLQGEDFTFELANRDYCSIVGRDDLVGKPLIEALPEIKGQGYLELLRNVVETGEAVTANESLVRIDRAGTGELEDTYVNFTYAPILEPDSDERVVVICHDVTPQVRARQGVQELARKAEQANEAKDEFLAMLGHELRNPLSPIVTALQLMRIQGDDSREVAVIERQVSHLLRLVDDLLDVSRITQGKVNLRKEPVDLGDVARRAIEMVSPLLEAGNAMLTVDIPTGLTVKADPDRMAQVISNVVGNAAKYSDKGGRIWVSGELDDDIVRLTVRDEGVGIEPDMLGRVFKLFSQQPQTLDRSRGGLGLGLAIVRNLVDLHGGTVSAHSEGHGRGSTFVIELPSLASVEIAAGTAKRTARNLEGDPRTRVLVVDDNIDAAETLEMALTSFGYDVVVACDGPSALEKTSEFKPHVALLDIGLPVMDGFELARRLRSTQDGGTVPCLVAVTGYGQQEDREKARAAGFDRHLVKPVDLQRLNETIGELTKNSREWEGSSGRHTSWSPTSSSS